MTRRIAVIDVGTNTVRLLVADTRGDGTYTDVLRTLVTPRLGHGVDHAGRLQAEPVRRAVAVVAEYVEKARGLGAEAIRIAATSAVRDATNRNVFLDTVAGTTGIRPEVLSGDEEARTAFAGAASSFPGDLLKVVVDIGGGSTEMVSGRERVEAAKSVDVGSVRLTERFVHTDPPTAEEQAAIRADAEAHLLGAAAVVAPALRGETPVVIGVAGTFTTVAALALGLETYDRARVHRATVTAEQAGSIRERLAGMTLAQRAAHPVILPGRADAVVAGAILVEESLRALGADRVVISETDILDGLLLALI